jgi:hypothetical protein
VDTRGSTPNSHKIFTSRTISSLISELIHEIWKIAEAAIEMYIFAKIYDIPRLCCDAVDRLVWCNNTAYHFDHCGTFVSASSIERAYGYTTPGSPLRELLISGFSDSFSSDGEEMVDLPRPYLIDIAKNFKCGKLSGLAQESLCGGNV